MLATLMTAVLAVAAADPPAKLEMFAKEDWYVKQPGKEDEFVGVLKFVDRGKNVVGFGRFNPYTLEMTTGDKKTVREVYAGGKPDLLKPYIGKTIKLTGKAVDMEVEGKNHNEIWAARLEVVEAPKEPKPQPEEELAARVKALEEKLRDLEKKAGEPGKLPKEAGQDRQKEILAKLDRLIAAAETKELTVVARGPWGAPAAPGTRPIQLVLRSPEELAKVTKMTEEQLAKQFKVDKIDWKKHMIVVATAGAKSSGGFKFEITNLTLKDDTLTVKWKLTPPEGFATNAFTHPGQSVLVERYEGKVVFDPPLPPEKKEPNPEDELGRAIGDFKDVEPKTLEPLSPQPVKPGPLPPVNLDVVDAKPANGQELKIVARGFWRAATQRGVETQQLVIRSPEELAKAGNLTEEQLLKQFKVDKIDWKTQMIVVATGGVKPTGGYGVEVESLTVKDKVLTVKWKLNSPKPGSILPQIVTHPGQAVLAERFEGEVKFDPPAPKAVPKDK